MSFRRALEAILVTILAAAGSFAEAQAPASAATIAPDPTPAPRKTVFVDVVGGVEAMYGGGATPGTTNEGLNAMIVDALMRSGRFVVVERVALGDVQLEQDLGKAGSTTAQTAASFGRMIGASAVVRATVTKFDANRGGGSLQLGLPIGRLFGGAASVGSQNAIVEMHLRIIDTSTGQVVSTSKASGVASSTTGGVSAIHRQGAAAGVNAFRNTPMGDAAEFAIEAAVRQIVQAMERVPWSASVADIDDDKVYLNAGVGQNLRKGMTLRVQRRGKVLTDPDTGAVLEVLMSDVGRIEIQSVGDRVSIARVIGGEPPVRGDMVRLDVETTDDLPRENPGPPRDSLKSTGGWPGIARPSGRAQPLEG